MCPVSLVACYFIRLLLFVLVWKSTAQFYETVSDRMPAARLLAKATVTLEPFSDLHW